MVNSDSIFKPELIRYYQKLKLSLKAYLESLVIQIALKEVVTIFFSPKEDFSIFLSEY